MSSNVEAAVHPRARPPDHRLPPGLGARSFAFAGDECRLADTMLATRVLSSEDWPVWRALRLAALAEAPQAFGSTLESWQGRGDSEQRWRARLLAVPFNVVAELDGTPVGMASGTHADAGAVELLSMWVAPAARGRTVGDRLIREVAHWARSRAAERLMLRVYGTNQHALSLYRRNGFQQTGLVKARAAGRADELELVCALD